MTKPRRRSGPTPYSRLALGTKATQGLAVFERVLGGATFRQAANDCGLSLTTAWRRYHWFADWTLPAYYGQPHGPIPPQRGTAACPRGRPYLPTVDGPGRPLDRSTSAPQRKVSTNVHD
jgi:hypothetical protein